MKGRFYSISEHLSSALYRQEEQTLPPNLAKLNLTLDVSSKPLRCNSLSLPSNQLFREPEP